MSELVELLSELVAVDSTNPDLVPGGAGEAEIGRLLATRLAAAGLEVDPWDVAPGRPNVVGRLPGAGGGRSLMLFGHMDVVGADPDAFNPHVREGRLHGRGAVDMKAGIAACVTAAQRLAAGPPLAGDLLVAFVSDEEWGSRGAEALVERHGADASVLAEPSNLEIVDAHGGFAWFDITSTGVDAAGWEAETGVDAISLLAPVLVGISELDATLAASATERWGRPSVHASTIRGGHTYPAYPGTCELSVERCLVPGERVAQSRFEIEELLHRARTADPRFQGSYRTVIAREPMVLPDGEPVVAELAAAAEQVLGRAVPQRCDIGWGDSGLLVEAGIPCVTFGPVGGGEHTADEWVELESVHRCAEIYERVARSFCSGAA
jgi:acetylornithine deacetylase